MTDSADTFLIVPHDGEVTPEGSNTRGGWTRDPLYSCSGSVCGGTCLVHSPDGICQTLAPNIEASAWTAPSLGTVRRVMGEVATNSLDKQLSVLLDLFEVTEREHRTSITNSVLAGKSEDGWPFTIEGQPFADGLFEHFHTWARAAQDPLACADVTLIPRWTKIGSPSETQFRPLAHLVLHQGPRSAGDGEDGVAIRSLGAAKISDSARLPFGSDLMKTPTARHEFLYVVSDTDNDRYKKQQESNNATDNRSVNHLTLNQFFELVKAHKQRKQRGTF